MSDTTLRLYDTLTKTKVPLVPAIPGKVRMYVCGPTVYDYAHIGNARPVIVFDVLFRLLRHIYGPDNVTYARNITDVDDKINARAARDYPGLPLNEAIAKVTAATEAQFKADAAALGCLEPTHEPRATEHIEAMRQIIERLVQRGIAYVAEGHVLFSPKAMEEVQGRPKYGSLARRSLDEMLAGARVDVAPYKRDPMDFVLWKPSKEGEPGWPSPCGLKGLGRPGWHIECSAMSMAKLLEPFGGGLECDDPSKNIFDIHGGGIDLVFPHHENEIAQSCCAFGAEKMANIWMHNGFLQVEGEKMSKSLGNFVTIHELLHTDKFGGRRWPGEVLRLAMLKTHYRQPIDWTVKALEEAESEYFELRDIAAEYSASAPDQNIIEALTDDLNTHLALLGVSQLRSDTQRGDLNAGGKLRATLELLGLVDDLDRGSIMIEPPSSPDSILAPIFGARTELDVMKDWLSLVPRNDSLGRLLKAVSNTKWEDSFSSQLKILDQFSRYIGRKTRVGEINGILPNVLHINSLIDARLEARRAKNFAESDRIRDELVAMGIQIMDAKDPVTGELTTTWQVKR